MHIYIAMTEFANPPTRKMARELRAAFASVVSFSVHTSAFLFQGQQYEPGYVLHTNVTPDPDRDAIVAMATAHDGSSDPPRFGVPVPVVATPADLPAQPPTIDDDLGMLAGTRNPPGLYIWHRGQWRAL